MAPIHSASRPSAVGYLIHRTTDSPHAEKSDRVAPVNFNLGSFQTAQDRGRFQGTIHACTHACVSAVCKYPHSCSTPHVEKVLAGMYNEILLSSRHINCSQALCFRSRIRAGWRCRHGKGNTKSIDVHPCPSAIYHLPPSRLSSTRGGQGSSEASGGSARKRTGKFRTCGGFFRGTSLFRVGICIG